jgi:hypothetical protein
VFSVLCAVLCCVSDSMLCDMCSALICTSRFWVHCVEYAMCMSNFTGSFNVPMIPLCKHHSTRAEFVAELLAGQNKNEYPLYMYYGDY